MKNKVEIVLCQNTIYVALLLNLLYAKNEIDNCLNAENKIATIHDILHIIIEHK